MDDDEFVDEALNLALALFRAEKALKRETKAKKKYLEEL